MAGSAAIGREARAELSRTVRDVMLLVVENLRNATPVATGHASSNWVVTFRSPFAGVDGSRAAVSVAQQEAGIRRLYRYDVGRDGPVFVRNNVHYLRFLDAGWSQQAPAGFVAIAIEAALRRAPYGRRGSARRMLKGLAAKAYDKGGRT